MPLAQALAEGLRIASEGVGRIPGPVDVGPGVADVVIGGAGFLGERLVARLLDASGDVVVVSRTPGGVVGRLESAGVTGEALARVRTVSADISDPTNAGRIAAALAGYRVGTVFHLAARVHAFEGWAALRAANVDGTLTAALLARHLGCRLQLASTLSVFVSSDGVGEGAETPLAATDEVSLFGGYAQTKAASEAVALAIPTAGTQVVRYGLLVPEDGGDLPADHFLRTFVEGVVQIGCVPEGTEEAWVDLTPVGEAGAAAMAIARSGADGVFHYANPVSASLTAFVAAIDDALARDGRRALEVVAQGEWRGRVRALGGLRGAILESAFDKAGFLSGTARRGPFLNADLFQSSGRIYGIGRSLAAGASAPTHPSLQVARLVRPLVA